MTLINEVLWFILIPNFAQTLMNSHIYSYKKNVWCCKEKNGNIFFRQVSLKRRRHYLLRIYFCNTCFPYLMSQKRLISRIDIIGKDYIQCQPYENHSVDKYIRKEKEKRKKFQHAYTFMHIFKKVIFVNPIFFRSKNLDIDPPPGPPLSRLPSYRITEFSPLQWTNSRVKAMPVNQGSDPLFTVFPSSGSLKNAQTSV